MNSSGQGSCGAQGAALHHRCGARGSRPPPRAVETRFYVHGRASRSLLLIAADAAVAAGAAGAHARVAPERKQCEIALAH